MLWSPCLTQAMTIFPETQTSKHPGKWCWFSTWWMQEIPLKSFVCISPVTCHTRPRYSEQNEWLSTALCSSQLCTDSLKLSTPPYKLQHLPDSTFTSHKGVAPVPFLISCTVMASGPEIVHRECLLPDDNNHRALQGSWLTQAGNTRDSDNRSCVIPLDTTFRA